MKIARFTFAVLGLLLASASGMYGAVFLTPSSYSHTANDNGTFSYQDTGGTELTDGLFGSVPFSNQAGADPWEAWLSSVHPSPSLSFNFSSPVNVTSVGIDFARWSGAQIALPNSVVIAGNTFLLTGNELADVTSGTLTFNVALNSVSSVPITLNASPGYVFVDEMQFLGSQTATGTPEPGTWTAFALGLGALAVLRRFKLR
jgi:hypothetical protein